MNEEDGIKLLMEFMESVKRIAVSMERIASAMESPAPYNVKINPEDLP